jgi:putative copper export protein
LSTLVSAVTGWVLFGGLTLATGAVVSRWLILPRAFAREDPCSEAHRNEVARLGTAGAILTVVGLALYLLRQLQEFRDPYVPWTEDAELLLFGTAWGGVWVRAAVGSLLAVVAFRVASWGRPIGWWLATPIVLALGTVPGLTGHAAAAEDLRSIALLSDWVHVWSVGAWMGGLAVVLYLERQTLHGGDDRTSLLPSLIPAFSPVAMAGVGALVLTGTFASWSHLSGFEALWTTGYGRSLLLKLILVSIVLALGAKNFRVLSPALGTPQADSAMRRSATAELLIAQLVLLVTAVLVRTSPVAP